MELRRMRKSDLRGLRGHGVGNGLNAVADADDGGLAGSVKIFLAVGREDPGAFAADGGGERFFEIAGKESGGHTKSLTKKRQRRGAEHGENHGEAGTTDPTDAGEGGSQLRGRKSRSTPPCELILRYLRLEMFGEAARELGQPAVPLIPVMIAAGGVIFELKPALFQESCELVVCCQQAFLLPAGKKNVWRFGRVGRFC